MGDVLVAKVAGRDIYGRPSDAHPTGMFLKKDGLQGMKGLPTARREALARAVAHGEHDVPVFLPARVITMDLWLLEWSEYELGKLTRLVSGLAAEGNSVTINAYENGEMLLSRGRRIVGEVTDLGGRRFGRRYVAEAQLQFVCADPRQYGEVVRFPESGEATSIPVFQRGNFPAHPIIDIRSAPASYTITGPGGTFTVAGATPGGNHRIDLRNGRVTRNDVLLSGVGRGALWAIPPGQRTTITLSAPGSVLISDTFV